ncbi:P-loop NTPase fold protein [Hamadaea tsunoensis]|uniref:P-loop NTPase fold protein n=1 Tax=Hamadaea tsunoensis TaxID=53368 RepID=UPI00146FAFEA|nr:P-loop NTPase fold protein [Hamadaea tsunoensis]
MMLDPSTYETPEHLWDGLTTEIVEGVVRRLPGGQVQRLRFDLNRHRIDPLALRRRILASFLPRTLMGALALCTAVALIVIGVVTASMTAIRTVNLSTLLGPTAVIVLAVLGFLGRSAISQAGTLGTWLLSQRDGVLGPGIRRRDATMPAGRAERLEDEVGPLLSLATRDSSVIIFLRGLDRCRPEIVAATLDFVHVFMNGALPPCTFVLAYDAPTVAAQLETIHTGLRERALAEPLSYGHLRHNGWAILEDYIDLPVRIPSLHGRAAADHLSPWLRRPGTRSADTSPYDVPQPRPGATSRPQPEPESDPYDGPAPRSFAQPELLTDVPEQPWSRIEDLESVRTAMSLAVQAIPDLSPQRIGVFINVWRFYVLLQYQRGQLSFALDEVVKRGCETARYAAILVGWAPILAGLSRPAVGNGSELHLTRLLAAAGDDHAWQTATTETGLDPRDPAAAALRELLRQPDGDDTILADLIRQYL